MRVVVVGGGFAGLAAAIALQEHRHDVTLLERRGVLGGRATSYPDSVTGEDVDNGTHLMIAGYEATLDLLRRAGASDLLIVQDHLRIDYRDDRGWTSLDCPDLPAPWHLLAGLLPLRLPWRSRLDVLRFGLAARAGRVPRGLTLAEWFERTGQSAETRRLVWDPLATAILNETPERAAAVLFREVFREAFLRRRDAARLVFLRAGYARLHDRLARYLEARGGVVHRRALAESVEVDGRACAGRALRPAGGDEGRDAARRARRHRSASKRTPSWPPCPGPRCRALVPEEIRAQAAVLRAPRGCAALRSSRSSCGSTASSWTGPWPASARPRWSGCSTRAGSTAARAPRSTSPSS